MNRAHPALPREQKPTEHPSTIANRTSTDVVTYLSEGWGANTCVRPYGTVYHANSTTDRGVEFLMGSYGILDRAPKGRDEGDGFQLWIRRQDE